MSRGGERHYPCHSYRRDHKLSYSESFVSNRKSFQAPPHLNKENVLKLDIQSCLLFAILNAMFRHAAASQTHQGSVDLGLKVYSME